MRKEPCPHDSIERTNEIWRSTSSDGDKKDGVGRQTTLTVIEHPVLRGRGLADCMKTGVSAKQGSTLARPVAEPQTDGKRSWLLSNHKKRQRLLMGLAMCKMDGWT